MNNKFEKFFYFKSLDLKIPEHISKKYLKDINKILFLSNLDLNSIKSNLKINFENEKLIFTYADLIEIWFIKFEKKDENIFIDLIANINAENEDIIKYELELEHQFLNHKNLGLNKIEWLGEFMLEIFIDIISFNWYKNIGLIVKSVWLRWLNFTM